jgi:hypothetical protein
MRRCGWLVLPVLLGVAACFAQETTILDAKKALSTAKKEVEKDVVFHPQDRGGGAYLKSEYARRFQEQQLEKKAERLGDSKENSQKYDVANRLETYKEKYKEEAFRAFIAYVAFVKTYRQYEELIKQDEPFQEKAGQLLKDLDEMIDRHAPNMTLDGLKLLYLEDPKGKVGAFKLPSPSRTVTINGETLDVIDLVTLKDQPVLLNKSRAKERKDCILAEIVGKGEYQTDDGETVKGFLLQAY